MCIRDRCGGIQIALLVQHMGLPGKGIHMTDEQIAGLHAQKAHIVAAPAVGDGGAVEMCIRDRRITS